MTSTSNREIVTTRIFDALPELVFEAWFLEVVPEHRIVFLANVHDDVKAHTTVTFTEHDGKTTLSVHQIYTRESDAARGANAGWTQTLNQLAEHVHSRM